MFNAMNAVSENQSIFSVSPFSNIYVILATVLSFILHFIILYFPIFSDIFHVLPLNLLEWQIVIWASLPIFAIDEVLKFISRCKVGDSDKVDEVFKK
jgi:Ca2+ transporting ATPase